MIPGAGGADTSPRRGYGAWEDGEAGAISTKAEDSV
jgi:hypothetical protein